MPPLTVAQVADKLGITPMRVRQWIEAGRMKATKFGKAWMIAPRDAVRPVKLPMGRPKS